MQVVYQLARLEVGPDAIIRLDRRQGRSDEPLTRARGGSLIVGHSTGGCRRVAQRGTFLRELVDLGNRRTPVPLWLMHRPDDTESQSGWHPEYYGARYGSSAPYPEKAVRIRTFLRATDTQCLRTALSPGREGGPTCMYDLSTKGLKVNANYDVVW